MATLDPKKLAEALYPAVLEAGRLNVRRIRNPQRQDQTGNGEQQSHVITRSQVLEKIAVPAGKVTGGTAIWDT